VVFRLLESADGGFELVGVFDTGKEFESFFKVCIKILKVVFQFLDSFGVGGAGSSIAGRTEVEILDFLVKFVILGLEGIDEVLFTLEVRTEMFKEIVDVGKVIPEAGCFVGF
jgi:hypothetical protein